MREIGRSGKRTHLVATTTHFGGLRLVQSMWRSTFAYVYIVHCARPGHFCAEVINIGLDVKVYMQNKWFHPRRAVRSGGGRYAGTPLF